MPPTYLFGCQHSASSSPNIRTYKGGKGGCELHFKPELFQTDHGFIVKVDKMTERGLVLNVLIVIFDVYCLQCLFI